MLQVALGAYSLGGEPDQFIDDPVYYEPGFNIMSPLELVSPTADSIYILIKKRGDENVDPSSVFISVTDVTNGENISGVVTINDLYAPWNEVNPSFTINPVVMRIDPQLNLSSPVLRIRVIDCFVKELTTNDFISFRIIVNDELQYVNYIVVNRKSISDRNTFSSASTESNIVLNGSSDSYILLSPYAWLQETADKSQADFSYPQDSIFYTRQKTYNQENYTFSIVDYRKSFIPEQISVMNIPGYSKVGIILVDNMLYSHLVEEGRSAFVVIRIEGELSGVIEDFKIIFHP